VENSKLTNPSLTELVQNGRFDEVVLYLSGLEKSRALRPLELVLKGRAIQLGSEVMSLPIEAAEEAFRAALADDPDYVPALLELGWFLHSVKDDSAQALPFFSRALDISRRSVKEAAKGKEECSKEAESDFPVPPRIDK